MISERILSTRTSRMGASAIREILKLLGQPGMVSLAGGIPAPESFPMDLIRELSDQVLVKYGSKALQYDLTEGFVPLREALSVELKNRGIVAGVDDIVITSGSQGALDAIGKICISPGDTVAMEAPTYLGAIQAFNPYGPNYVRMDTDDDGLIPESMENVLKTHTVKFVYLVPTFQNPTGRTLSLERRKRIAAIAQEQDVLIIEDDPYSALRFSGEPIPPIKTLAPDHVAYMGSFSKVLSPGLRLGYTVAPHLIGRWMTLAKQGVDLNTSTLGQALAAEYIAGGHLVTHVRKIIDLYAPKQKAMLEAMDAHFPSEWRYSRPAGGMFVWAEGPDGVETETLYHTCVARKAAFVPGKFFYTEKGEGLATMRLNFTMASVDQIRWAIHVIADAIRESH
ncbi:PLP-dependent aminotransferase family protein [bacterium]|nr:PLP-dependent aminotransferase family protein [candidate division CSSED10-310 bacterium]